MNLHPKLLLIKKAIQLIILLNENRNDFFFTEIPTSLLH